jgi:hypothetical protein
MEAGCSNTRQPANWIFPGTVFIMRWNYSMANQPGNILALDWYKDHGLKAMIATATNAEGGMLFQSDERDKGMASSGIISIQELYTTGGKKKYFRYALHGMG